MEKKEYMKPQTETINVQMEEILASSPVVGGGETGEQNSREAGTEFEFNF